MKEKKFRERINRFINSPQVRVIDENGDALGVMSNYEAQQLAQSKALDLIEISPNSSPPVCRISDYGKFKYEREKKEKLVKKTQVVMQVKEVRFNPNTDKHDIEFKTKHIRQFLIEGHKIKVNIMFRGRMITHPEIGRKLMDDVLEKVTDLSKVEAPPKMEGKQLIAYLMADKAKIAAYLKAEKQNEKQQARPVSEKSAETKALEQKEAAAAGATAPAPDTTLKAALDKAVKDSEAKQPGTAPLVEDKNNKEDNLNTGTKE